MKILISNSSSESIYEQICTQIKNLILKGELKEGDPLPSIRTLAKELHISVITTKRAYEELENDGFIETLRGKGSFIAPQNKELFKERKMKVIEDKLEEAVIESKSLDITLEELMEILSALYEE